MTVHEVDGALAELLAGPGYSLPRTGQGRTLERWQALYAVARQDLALVKLYEGHVDAVSILDELGRADLIDGRQLWATWAAEAPDGRTIVSAGEGSEVRLTGRKRWCSGARQAGRGLLTAWWPDGRGPQLVAVDMRDAGVSVDAGAWRAVGMAASESADVAFDNARAQRVGEVGDYLERPGFWQGGAGIAACWLGGATGLADALAQKCQRPDASPFALAALGHVDAALSAAMALLRETAAWIDEHPTDHAVAAALRCRLAVEAACGVVIEHVGRALGATPYARDDRFARLAADLPVFLRQSHAEQDAAALASASRGDSWRPWAL